MEAGGNAAQGMLQNVVRAWWSAQEAYWSRSCAIGFRAVGGSIDRMAGGAGRPFSAERWLGYLSERSMAPWLALARFGDELDRAESGPAGPPQMAYTVDPGEGQSTRPVTLPMRVVDAAQGMAIFACSAARATAALNQQYGGAFLPLDLGRGRTVAELFIVSYRAGDLGSYLEFGFGFFAVPRDDPGAVPGLLLTDLPVTDNFSRAAGRSIWGYPKTMATLTWTESAADVTLSLAWPVPGSDPAAPRQAPLLSVQFPRGGRGSSAGVPIYSYTLKDGQPYGTMFSRVGRGERVSMGGRAPVLTLGPSDQHSQDRLWRLLADLGLAERRPALWSWTEHMSGELGAPRPLSR